MDRRIMITIPAVSRAELVLAAAAIDAVAKSPRRTPLALGVAQLLEAIAGELHCHANHPPTARSVRSAAGAPLNLEEP